MAELWRETQLFIVDWSSTWREAAHAQMASDALQQATLRKSSPSSTFSVLVPSEQRWLCLFEAQDENGARTLAGMAQVPERYVHRALDLMPRVVGA